MAVVDEVHTKCFVCQRDHHPSMDPVHLEHAIDNIALLLMRRVDLLPDASLLLLQNKGIIPSGEPSITEKYTNLAGGDLDEDQTKLADMLGQVYRTADLELLNTRRGAILERIVYRAVNRRRTRIGEDVYLNVSYLRASGTRGKAPNPYSVDVAACFPFKPRVELYACKLHAINMPRRDVEYLDELGEHFAGEGRNIDTAICCAQTRSDLNEEVDYWDLLEDFPDIITYAIDEIADLM